MPRKPGPLYNNVLIGAQNSWVCRFCKEIMARSSTTMIKAHLAGVRGFGITGCLKVDGQTRSEALMALKGKRALQSSYNRGKGPHLSETVNNGDDCRVALNYDAVRSVPFQFPWTANDEDDFASWCYSSPVISTVPPRSSAFFPLPDTNSPNQSLPAQNMNPQTDFPFKPRSPQFHAGDFYLQPLNFLISEPDLATNAWTNLLCPVNAEVEELNTEVPRGNEGRIDNIRSNDDQVAEVFGKIVVSRRKIGKGSNGTVVYEGTYDGRLAAVKRLVRAYFDDDASKEIDILIKSDRHENIVRYYGVEKSQHFVDLALELCTCSLDDLIQVHSDSSNNSAFPGDPASMDDDQIKLASVRSMMQKYSLWQADGYPSRLLLKLMRDMLLGLSHLHDLRIIHRDLKPQNVLIAENQGLVARLSDMGISRCLPEDKSSLGYSATGCGTSGWRAPEVLRSGGHQTLAMDLFSLGCVLFFCITRGKHPFGDNIVRDSNILDDKKDLSQVEFIPEAHDLILCLLNRVPKLRPKASEVPHHPFFWSSKTRLSFLSDVSDLVEFETRAGNLDLLNALERTAQSVFVGNWEDKIEPAVRAELWRRRHYNNSLVRHLLRAVRNVYSHHMEFPEKVKEILGPVDGLDAYFAIRFPRLLIESYRVVTQICRRKELLEGVLSK